MNVSTPIHAHEEDFDGRTDGEGVEQRVDRLLARLGLGEKIEIMSGDAPPWRWPWELLFYNRKPFLAGVRPRHGIAGIRFSDGPRGVVMGHATCFPVAMARGATWDPELEEQVGSVMGTETRCLGGNLFAGICINLLRHPAWGRAQETYGEDTVHVGEMGAALLRGVQRHVMGCVKHFALNSIENSRFRVDVRIEERTLREVYLPHFKRCVDEGAAAIMSAYNKVRGVYCGHNAELLRTILRDEWGFDGFVMSDFLLGIRDAAQAVNGGLDLEMPFKLRFCSLATAVRRGRVRLERIDDAVRRILRQQLRFAGVGSGGDCSANRVACAEHRSLAREVATRSMVLLRNKPDADGIPLLPLRREVGRRILVAGKLAARGVTGDLGSSRVRPPTVVTILEGLRAAAGASVVDFDDGTDPVRAVQAAVSADTVIVVAGYTHADEGENVLFRGGDRESLRLRDADEALILALAAAHDRVVVVLVCGSAVVTDAWREKVGAILVAWYPGMEGGHAVADLLFGDHSPSGRLPCTFPRCRDQLPFFDASAERIEYGFLHGYRLFDATHETPAYPFGFGLTYTRFVYSRLRLAKTTFDGEPCVQACIDVTNTGRRSGDEVVQLYVSLPGSRVERAPKDLKAFRRVRVKPGETVTVVLHVPIAHLAWYDADAHRWQVEPGTYRFLAAPDASGNGGLEAELAIADAAGAAERCASGPPASKEAGGPAWRS